MLLLVLTCYHHTRRQSKHPASLFGARSALLYANLHTHTHTLLLSPSLSHLVGLPMLALAGIAELASPHRNCGSECQRLRPLGKHGEMHPLILPTGPSTWAILSRAARRAGACSLASSLRPHWQPVLLTFFFFFCLACPLAPVQVRGNTCLPRWKRVRAVVYGARSASFPDDKVLC